MEDLRESTDTPLSREERLRKVALRIIQHKPPTAEIWPSATEEDEEKAAGSLPPLTRYLKDKGLVVYAYVMSATKSTNVSGKFASLKERLSSSEADERQRLEKLQARLSFLGSRALEAAVQKRPVIIDVVRDKLATGPDKRISGDLYIAKSDHGEESTSTLQEFIVDNPDSWKVKDISELEELADSLDKQSQPAT